MGGCRGYFLALFWVIENNSFFGSLYYIDRMEMVSIFIVLSIDVYIPYRHGALELLKEMKNINVQNFASKNFL